MNRDVQIILTRIKKKQKKISQWKKHIRYNIHWWTIKSVRELTTTEELLVELIEQQLLQDLLTFQLQLSISYEIIVS